MAPTASPQRKVGTLSPVSVHPVLRRSSPRWDFEIIRWIKSSIYTPSNTTILLNTTILSNTIGPPTLSLLRESNVYLLESNTTRTFVRVPVTLPKACKVPGLFGWRNAWAEAPIGISTIDESCALDTSLFLLKNIVLCKDLLSIASVNSARSQAKLRLAQLSRA